MRVRLASYNVHGFVGTDGVYDVERVARVVRALNADVVALQEVIFDRRQDGALLPVRMLSQLADYALASAVVDRGDGLSFGNAVLTRFPIQRERRICLSYAGREPRSALEVVLETGARPLHLVATHLGLRPRERRFQVQRLLEEIAGDERSVTVLLGDFNEWLLYGRPLRWLHARFGQGAAAASYPARFPLLGLDRIWTHPKEALHSFCAHKSGEARAASDHLPVIASVDVGR